MDQHSPMTSYFRGSPSSATGSMTSRSQILLPGLWELWHWMANEIDNRTSVYRSQWNVLRDQFKVSIMSAETCASRGVGAQEIFELKELIDTTNRFLNDARHEQWTSAVRSTPRLNEFILNQARGLDRVLSNFANILNSNFDSTVARIGQAKARDDIWIDQFVERVDRASPAPVGTFIRAYREGNYKQLDSLATQVLSQQTELLSTPSELQFEESNNAKELTNWIMNLTRKRPASNVLLGQRFVGPFTHYLSTSRYELFRSTFVTGEAVIIKALRQNIPGKDIGAQIRRFQERTEVWHSLRYDFTLPFYGIGRSDINGQTLIYSVAPYMANGDAANYNRNSQISTKKSLALAFDAAQGLQYLHKKSPPIVHLGVRTDNILVDEKGQGVLAGFGLIEEADSERAPSHTGMGDFNRYKAPEHLGPPFPGKTSADVWAWAMVALELVGGQEPFYDVNDFQAATLTANGQRPKREKYPRVNEIVKADAFWQLLEDCWAQDETDRPDMNNVVSRLEKLNKANETDKLLPIRGDPTTNNDPLSDGRPNRPVAQGPQPRRI